LIQKQIKDFLSDIKNINDPGTEDFLVSVLREHEEMSWMLKSHLE
jgi:DNA-binding ferritin-like protein